ncbi:MAG: hypothetical protein RL206_399 [Bacteroidota bacterium]|jgi:hypothetical protein
MVATDVQRLEALWADPSRVAASDMLWLATLVEANPAAVPLWWLYLRAVQKAESPQFTQVLHRCAALSPNRSALMAWVEEPLQPIASGEAVSSEAVSSELVSGELVSGDLLLASGEPVSGDSSVVIDQEPQETSNEEPQVASSEEPTVVDQPHVGISEEQQETSSEKPASADIEPPTRLEPKATNAATLNLDALPERVREQILRARAARAQLAEVGFGTAQSPPKAEPVETVSAPAVPAPEPKSVAPAVRTSEPAAKKPKQETTQASQVANEQTLPALPTSPAAPTSLSPFAQFVANLEGSSSSPKGSELIDQFLAVNPKISPLAKDAPAPEVRTEPDANVTGLVTETLARMYAEQGHVAKAIQAYEILKLRVPEKSSIFAARIEALKTK